MKASRVLGKVRAGEPALGITLAPDRPVGLRDGRPDGVRRHLDGHGAPLLQPGSGGRT